MLALRGGGEGRMFKNPSVFMEKEDGVQAGCEGRIYLGPDGAAGVANGNGGCMRFEFAAAEIRGSLNP